MTQTWNEESPQKLGIYEASRTKKDGILRYWNGEQWSSAFTAEMDKHKQARCMERKVPVYETAPMFWREQTLSRPTGA